MSDMFDRKLQETLEVRKTVKVNPTVYVYVGPGIPEALQQIRISADSSCPLIYIYPEPADDQFLKTAVNLPLTIPVKIDSGTTERCILAVNCLKPSQLMFTADSRLKLNDPAFPKQLNIQLKNILSGLHHEKLTRLTNLRCALRNLPKIKDCCQTRVEVKSGSAVICGSGPSLQTQLDYLKAIQKNVYLIAIGKTGERLVREGINPDAIVFVDTICSDINWENVFKTSNAMLITFPTAAPGVIAYAQNTYFAQSPSYYFNQAMKDWGVALPPLHYAGTGTVTGIDFAVKAGFDHICLIGNDMCLGQNGVSHIAGYDDENKYVHNMLSVPGIDGQPVTTSNEFDDLRQKLEQSMKHISVDIYNCTAYGAAIAGTIPLPFEEFIKTKAITPPMVKITHAGTSFQSGWSKYFERCAEDHAEHLFEESLIPPEAMENYGEYRSSWLSNLTKAFIEDLEADLMAPDTAGSIKYKSFRRYAIDFVKQSNPEFSAWLEVPPPDAGKEFIFTPNQTERAFISLPRPDGQTIPFTASYINTLNICLKTMKQFLSDKHFNPRKHGVVFVEPASWMHVVALDQLAPETEIMALLLWPGIFSRLIDYCMFMHRIPHRTTVVACDKQFKNWRRLYHKTIRDWRRSGREPLFFDNPYAGTLPEFKSLYDQLPS